MFAMFSNSPLLLVAADLVPRQSRDKILSCFLKPQLFNIFILKSNNSVTLTERTDRHSGFKRSKHPSLSSLSTLCHPFLAADNDVMGGGVLSRHWRGFTW